MQVTPFLDRTKPIPEHKLKSGFINGIVLPLYEAFSKSELNIDIVLQNLEANLRVFQNAIAADSTASIASAASASSLPRPASAATATPCKRLPGTRSGSLRGLGRSWGLFLLRKPKAATTAMRSHRAPVGTLTAFRRSSPTPVR